MFMHTSPYGRTLESSMTTLGFEGFLDFSHAKMFHALLVHFLPQVCSWLGLQGTLI